MNNWTKYRKEILETKCLISIDENDLNELFNGNEDDVITIEACVEATSSNRLKEIETELELRLNQFNIDTQKLRHMIMHITHPKGQPFLVNELQEITDWMEMHTNNDTVAYWSYGVNNEDNLRIILAGK